MVDYEILSCSLGVGNIPLDGYLSTLRFTAVFSTTILKLIAGTSTEYITTYLATLLTSIEVDCWYVDPT
jgi:hypothetical protein